MPESPTYRVTGDDWDQPEPRRLEPPPVAAPAASETPAPPSGTPSVVPPVTPPVTPAGKPAEKGAVTAHASEPPPTSGWATPPVGPPDKPPPSALPRPAMRAGGDGEDGSGGGRLASRLPAPIGPILTRTPTPVLLAIAGLGVAVVAIILFMSARPTDVAATATTEPTQLAPLATESCPTPAVPLPLPSLVVKTQGAEPRRLGGFAAEATELDLDGPWPATLGPVEATVPLGSTMTLSTTGACVAEWRAVAARPPVETGKPWRPLAPETVQLGWQHADRIAWQPAVPLPPRGEWIVRLTVWYRDAAGATSPSPAATAPGGGEAAGSWFVERYFRVVVEARDSS